MFRFTLIICVACLLGGCAGFMALDSRQAQSSSLVDYLYPNGQRPDHRGDELPVIDLPARVGLAFVPSAKTPLGLTAGDRERLLAEVRRSFSSQAFIGRIEIIPDVYLRPGGGFDNLDQLAALHGLDIIALVSWDQIVQSRETTRSMLYWTLVGAYVVEASRNEVVTFVDTAVMHVPSRSLLFRAPGQDQRGDRSTAISAGRVQEKLAINSFDSAMDDMILALDQAMVDFNRRVRSEGQVRLVDRRSGRDWHQDNGGAGSFSLLPLALLILLAGCRISSTSAGARRIG